MLYFLEGWNLKTGFRLIFTRAIKNPHSIEVKEQTKKILVMVVPPLGQLCHLAEARKISTEIHYWVLSSHTPKEIEIRVEMDKSLIQEQYP